MDTAKFNSQLLALRQQLLHYQDISRESSKPVKLEQNKVGRLSRMEAIQDQQMAKDVRKRRAVQLQKVELALTRIENGEYGYCFSCDELINPLRLQFDPTMTLCINCAS